MKYIYNQELKPLARNLRNQSTKTEIMLWNHLKARQLKGYQFNRQKPLGNYIVDFLCKKLNLVIEIDGASHTDKTESDMKKQVYLNSIGLTV